MTKPNVQAIRTTVALTDLHPEFRSPDPMARCHLCGVARAGDSLRLWHECDERDQPIRGHAALLFVCTGKGCNEEIKRHPRLYVDDAQGLPGHFPGLCGDCQFRQGIGCRHPDLKANGGPGLKVKLTGLDGIVCIRGAGGCRLLQRTAVECAGFVEVAQA